MLDIDIVRISQSRTCLTAIHTGYCLERCYGGIELLYRRSVKPVPECVNYQIRMLLGQMGISLRRLQCYGGILL